MTAFHNKSSESVVFLTKAGVPVTGVARTAVLVNVRKAGATIFSVKTLAPTDWVELGYGVYVVKWSAVDMGVLGQFVFRLASTSIDPYVGIFDILPAPVGILANPLVCVVSGNIVDIGGQPSTQQQVSFRVSQLPAATGSSFVAGGYVTTSPDAYGNFSVALLQGKSVIVEIVQTGLKHVIAVPAQATASLLDLLPPLP